LSVKKSKLLKVTGQMNRAIITILSLMLFAKSFAQSQLQNHVCNIDGITVDANEIRNNLKLHSTDELFQYLNQINSLFEQPYARYTLMDIKNLKLAAAHIQLIGNDYARVISINKDYYTSKISNPAHKKALFIWIIAHELTHHINGDLHYDLNGIIANNYKREILADERAGYAVGMLTNVDIDFFDKELPSVLYENPESSTHPVLKYRIFSAKAGWLQAKLKKNNRLNSCSKIYKKEEANKKQIIGRFYNESFNGIVFIKYGNKNTYFGNCTNGKINGEGVYFSYNSAKLTQIYLGEQKEKTKNGEGMLLFTNGDAYKGNFKDNHKEGRGTMRNYNGNWYKGTWSKDKMDGEGTYVWKNGDIYEGQWKNGLRNGYGTFTYSNGKKYRGDWKNNKKHGDGLLYKGNTMISAGCWKNDNYIGTECK